MFSITYFPYTQVLAVLIMSAICFFERYIVKYKKILYCFSVVGMAVYPMCAIQSHSFLISIASALLWLTLLFCFKFKKFRMIYTFISSSAAIIVYFLFCSMGATPILFCWAISAMYVILLFYKFVYCAAKKMQKNHTMKFIVEFEKIKKRYTSGEITESEYKKLKAKLLDKI